MDEERFNLAMEGSFYGVAYCCAQWGEEVQLADLLGTAAHWDKGQSHPTKHVVIALLVRLKGETRESYHLLLLAHVTNQGLEPRKWISRLLGLYEKREVWHGPLFWSPTGQRVRPGEMEPKFFDRMDYVKDAAPISSLLLKILAMSWSVPFLQAWGYIQSCECGGSPRCH